MYRMFSKDRANRATSSADMSTFEVTGLLYSMIGSETASQIAS